MRRIVFDAVLLAAYALVAVPALTGVGVHEWLGGYRQESCALFRQPHKPAVRCGYPSSRVTSR